MGMEVVGSVMSIQAQSQVSQRQAIQPAKTAAEYTDVSAQDTVQKTDINIVENTQEKGNSSNDPNNGESKQPSTEQIRKAVETLNKKMTNSVAVFGIHEGTNRVTIKIIDKDTKDVIKELPPEKTLDMIAKVWEMAGILVDERR